VVSLASLPQALPVDWDAQRKALGL